MRFRPSLCKQNFSIASKSRSVLFLSALIVFLLLFNYSNNHFVTKASPPSLDGGDVLFEPYNAMLMPESGRLFVPFIAGWVSNTNPIVSFDSIDVFAIIDDDKEFLFNYGVNESLVTCYNDTYIDNAGESKLVHKVESDCVLENQEYILSYEDTLKEAIGFANTNSYSTENETVLDKLYNSIDYDKMIELQMTDVFDDFSDGDLLVFICEGLFYLPLSTNPIRVSREITVYVTCDYDDVWLLSTPNPNPGVFDKRFRTVHSFWKGDGHIHSDHSDGNNPIKHPMNETDERKKKKSIAHYRRTKLDMDWLIFTDHAGYFWPNQKTSTNHGGGYTNFNAYCTNCNEGNQSSQQIERNEINDNNPKSHFLVVPAIELAVTTKDTSCVDDRGTFQTLRESHVLNYYGPHINNRVHRWPDWRVNGSDFIKNIAGESNWCNNDYYNKGPNGWAILAHPAAVAYGWKHFPATAEDWGKEWDLHKSPSVIRSFGDSNSNNDGKGIMGIEVLSGGNISDLIWDKYLCYDTYKTIGHWNEDDFNNNFVVGVGNSDSHQFFWQKAIEDITGLKAHHYAGNCVVSSQEVEEREVPHFENIPYWYARFQEELFSKGFSFVYRSSAPLTSPDLLEAIRSCGQFNKGLSFSKHGSFATFTANDGKLKEVN